MIPTFNATRLLRAFKQAIDSIETAISATKNFDPARSTRCFRLALSDLGEPPFLPLLVRALQPLAPSVGLEVVQLDSETKVADLAITFSNTVF
jgi:DNA-binding transcriptional LysR family regulator